MCLSTSTTLVCWVKLFPLMSDFVNAADSSSSFVAPVEADTGVCGREIFNPGTKESSEAEGVSSSSSPRLRFEDELSPELSLAISIPAEDRSKALSRRRASRSETEDLY